MSISVTCASCEKQYKVKDELAGKRIRCPECREIVTVGMGTSSSAVKRRVADDDDDDEPEDEDDVQVRRRPRPLARRREDEYADDDDLQVRRRPRPPARRRDDDENEEEERPKKRKRSRRKGSTEIPWGMIGGGIVGLAILFAFFMLFVFPPLSFLIAAGFLLAGIGLAFVGSIGCLIRAFQEDTVCGLLYLFVPFYGLYYLVTRWDDLHPFGGCVVGGVLAEMVGYGFIFGAAAIMGGEDDMPAGQPGMRPPGAIRLVDPQPRSLFP